MSTLPEDIFLHVSKWMNAKEIIYLSKVNKDLNNYLREKNDCNKKKKLMILSKTPSDMKRYPLLFALRNLIFDTFIKMLYSGLFPVLEWKVCTPKESKYDLLFNAAKSLNFNQFLEIYMYYKRFHVDYNDWYLKNIAVKYRRPSTEKNKILAFLRG